MRRPRRADSFPLKEVHMKIVIAVTAAVLLLGFAQEVVAEKPGSDPAGLERKLHGAWIGQGPCAGYLTLRADGTYEHRNYGPGGANLRGAWTVRWDALPPTLVLTCKTSDDKDYIGKTWEVKVIQLDEDVLVYQFAKATPSRYSRER